MSHSGCREKERVSEKAVVHTDTDNTNSPCSDFQSESLLSNENEQSTAFGENIDILGGSYNQTDSSISTHVRPISSDPTRTLSHFEEDANPQKDEIVATSSPAVRRHNNEDVFSPVTCGRDLSPSVLQRAPQDAPFNQHKGTSPVEHGVRPAEYGRNGENFYSSPKMRIWSYRRESKPTDDERAARQTGEPERMTEKLNTQVRLNSKNETEKRYFRAYNENESYLGSPSIINLTKLVIQNYTLRARSPNLSDDDVAAYIAQLRTNPAAISSTSEAIEKLQVAELEGVSLSDDGLCVLIPGLLRAPNLVVLNLAHNNISDNSASVLAECFFCMPHLRVLDLSQNRLTSKGALHLTRQFLMRGNPACGGSRDSSHREEEVSQPKSFCKGGSHNVSFRSHEPTSPTQTKLLQLYTLDLSDNLLGAHAAITIVHEVRASGLLVRLRLRNVGLNGSLGLSNIFEGNLYGLDISGNLLFCCEAYPGSMVAQYCINAPYLNRIFSGLSPAMLAPRVLKYVPNLPVSASLGGADRGGYAGSLSYLMNMAANRRSSNVVPLPIHYSAVEESDPSFMHTMDGSRADYHSMDEAEACSMYSRESSPRTLDNRRLNAPLETGKGVLPLHPQPCGTYPPGCNNIEAITGEKCITQYADYTKYYETVYPRLMLNMAAGLHRLICVSPKLKELNLNFVWSSKPVPRIRTSETLTRTSSRPLQSDRDPLGMPPRPSYLQLADSEDGLITPPHVCNSPENTRIKRENSSQAIKMERANFANKVRSLENFQFKKKGMNSTGERNQRMNRSDTSNQSIENRKHSLDNKHHKYVRRNIFAKKKKTSNPGRSDDRTDKQRGEESTRVTAWDLLNKCTPSLLHYDGQLMNNYNHRAAKPYKNKMPPNILLFLDAVLSGIQSNRFRELRILSLSGNNLDDIGTSRLCRGLGDMPQVCLEQLYLAKNGIQKLNSICTLVERKKTLRILDLAHNNIDDCVCLSKCLGSWRGLHLLYLSLANNPISEDAVRDLTMTIRNISIVYKNYLSSNPVEEASHQGISLPPNQILSNLNPIVDLFDSQQPNIRSTTNEYLCPSNHARMSRIQKWFALWTCANESGVTTGGHDAIPCSVYSDHFPSECFVPTDSPLGDNHTRRFEEGLGQEDPPISDKALVNTKGDEASKVSSIQEDGNLDPLLSNNESLSASTEAKNLILRTDKLGAQKPIIGLRLLDLSHTHISDEAVKQLALVMSKSACRLEVLNITGSSSITAIGEHALRDAFLRRRKNLIAHRSKAGVGQKIWDQVVPLVILGLAPEAIRLDESDESDGTQDGIVSPDGVASISLAPSSRNSSPRMMQEEPNQLADPAWWFSGDDQNSTDAFYSFLSGGIQEAQIHAPTALSHIVTDLAADDSGLDDCASDSSY